MSAADQLTLALVVALVIAVLCLAAAYAMRRWQ